MNFVWRAYLSVYHLQFCLMASNRMYAVIEVENCLTKCAHLLKHIGSATFLMANKSDFWSFIVIPQHFFTLFIPPAPESSTLCHSIFRDFEMFLTLMGTQCMSVIWCMKTMQRHDEVHSTEHLKWISQRKKKQHACFAPTKAITKCLAYWIGWKT